MTDSEFKVFLSGLYDAIDWRELARQVLLNRESGHKVCIFRDGSLVVLSDNEFFYNSDEHIATIFTPGVGNLDSSFFADGFVEWREKENGYVVSGKYHEDKGRFVGALENVIEECIQDGDISCFLEDWWEDIKRQANEWRITRDEGGRIQGVTRLIRSC